MIGSDIRYALRSLARQKLATMMVAGMLAIGIADIAPQANSATGVSLDHVPIAVRDLPAARSWWHERLGFSIKPGRLHANTVDNSHMKFPDGTEIELITASEPIDSLAARYRHLIKLGDGGAFLALRPDTISGLAERLIDRGLAFSRSGGSYYESLDFGADTPLGYLFFIALASPPVDLPEHVTHPNTATTLFAAWLRKPDFSAEEQLLTALGVPVRRDALELADGLRADDVALSRGHLYLIRSQNPAGADRPVVGLTVAVADLDSAGGMLHRLGPHRLEGMTHAGATCASRPSRQTACGSSFSSAADRDRGRVKGAGGQRGVRGR